MDIISTKKSIFTIALISLAIFSSVIAISLFAHLVNIESRLNKEKQSLIEENIELKNELDSIKSNLKMKTEALARLEVEKSSFLQELEKAREKSREAANQDKEEVELLRKENKSLRAELAQVKSLSVTHLMKEALQAEDNESVKKILEEAITKIDMVRSGKSVTLEPIVVSEKQTSYNSVVPVSFGKVLSVDTRNNLIAIDLGRDNNVNEGQRCVISKDGSEVGSAEIIRARLKISAAFVDEIKHKYNIKDIKVGDRVTIPQ